MGVGTLLQMRGSGKALEQGGPESGHPSKEQELTMRQLRARTSQVAGASSAMALSRSTPGMIGVRRLEWLHRAEGAHGMAEHLLSV